MIHLWSSFGQMGGWGSLAHGFATALDRIETVVALSWEQSAAVAASVCASFSADEMGNGRRGVEVVALGLGPWENMPRTDGRRRIAAVVGETSRVPESLLRNVRHAHQVWVPTAWGREVLVRSGLDRDLVRVVPYGVDLDLFEPANPAPNPRETFRFLSVGKWERRKGQEDLVRAFCRAFETTAPVELYLHCHNPYRPGFDVARRVRELMDEEGGGSPIHLGRPLPPDDLRCLYQSADAFVLPSRGEGWGLPILEAMACGLPVVVTDHPAIRTFAGPPHAYLIDATPVPVDDPVFFDPTLDWGEWLEPDLDHLVELLRGIAQDRTASRRHGRVARRAASRWSWDHAARVGHDEIASLRRAARA